MANGSQTVTTTTIDTGTGVRLLYYAEGRLLWIGLESEIETLAEARESSESLVVAGSSEDVDRLIAALLRARPLFDSPPGG